MVYPKSGDDYLVIQIRGACRLKTLNDSQTTFLYKDPFAKYQQAPLYKLGKHKKNHGGSNHDSSVKAIMITNFKGN